MDCPRCQRSNRSDARFCDGCGSALAPSCTSCGRELRPEARFCDGCGAATGATAAETGPEPESEAARDPRAYTPPHLAQRILTQKSSLEGERKQVTVLFADVAGYTPLAERADPEEMHILMDRCFKRILDAVHRYEGTVNQFTGDGVMALFGAPLAIEDAPRRAVLAALAIQQVLAGLDAETRERYGLPFRMRIGLNSGPVVVGSIGDDLRMDYTAVGDTTNLAARLQQAAQPGAVLISRATERRVAGFFELRSLGAIGVKGKSEPVEAFEVLAERPVSGRIEVAAEVGLTPLVGREAELDQLESAFHSAREGRGLLAMIVGDAGIGKSRLLHEFRQRLKDQRHRWLEGRCSPYGSTTAFQALVDMQRRGLGIEDRDDEARAGEKLERSTAELGEDLAWTLPFLQRLLSLPVADRSVAEMDAMDRRRETYRALHARFRRAAEQEPLVMVVEDLHWLDRASEEFLTFLAETLPTARALLIVTYRPGYEQPFGDRSYHLRLAPRPLSHESMSAMAGAVLASNAALPEELLELIAKKAEGNPLFVEEVTRSLLEEGVLRLADGRVELAHRLQEISVPDRIQDVLMARIDRLPEEPKRAIQVAAVIGREFALRLLDQVREAGDRVQEVVGELRSLELIYEKAAHPELAFMFKHALTHDVAYESILQARRKTLHRIVGSAIEELYADRLTEHYEALAHHFDQGEDWQKALLYLEKAAAKAAAAYANRAVLEHCRRALRIAARVGGDELDGRRHLLEQRLGNTHFALSEFPLAGAAHRRAAELAPDPATRAIDLGRAALSLVWAHDYEGCEEAAAAAIEANRGHGPPVGHTLARTAQDLLRVATHGLRGQRDAGAEATRLADRTQDIEAKAMALSQRALFLEQLGLYPEAIATSRQALEVGKDARLSLISVYPRWSLGKALVCIGRYEEGLAVFESALEDCDRCGDRALKARLLNTIGWCLAEFGCHAIACEYNLRGEELAREMVRLELVAGAPELHANAAVNLANNHTALGDPARALGLLEPLAAELEAPGDPWQRWRYTPHVHHAQARAYLELGEPERARELTGRELACAREHGMQKLEARALELSARALLLMDRRDAARSGLHEAVEVATRIAYPPVLWRAEALLAELARREGREPEARGWVAAARGRVARLSQSLTDPEQQRGFRALGAALAETPLATFR